MSTTPPRGLPPGRTLLILIPISLVFLAAMAYLLAKGYGVNGSVFGKAGPASQQAQTSGDTNVQGGPPPAVMLKVKSLMARIAAHPNDDVSLTALGDMFLSAQKFDQAIPLYRRALKANPGNVAAQGGLQEAQAGTAPGN